MTTTWLGVSYFSNPYSVIWKTKLPLTPLLDFNAILFVRFNGHTQTLSDELCRLSRPETSVIQQSRDHVSLVGTFCLEEIGDLRSALLSFPEAMLSPHCTSGFKRGIFI